MIFISWLWLYPVREEKARTANVWFLLRPDSRNGHSDRKSFRVRSFSEIQLKPASVTNTK
ncbi:MAG TPA: hypothetical protein DCY03_02850 [Planctomycetaceae bacterium]|nr:hypothetical protein [Planctomycetaceae bacterium]